MAVNRKYTKRKHRRLGFVAFGLALLGTATAIVLTQLNDHLVFFHSPSELVGDTFGRGNHRLRLGGLVEQGSVDRQSDGGVRFRVTDMAAAVPVAYHGILPDLFREGQGVVVEGRFQRGLFVADSVLAKHDENYMPPDVADALKRSGHWQPPASATAAAGGTQQAATP